MNVEVRRRYSSFGLSRGYDVLDESKERLYTAEQGKDGYSGVYCICDASGNVCGTISKKHDHGVFDITENENSGRLRIERSISGLHAVMEHLGWDVSGDVMNYDFEVTENGFCVVKISRVLISLNPCFSVKIANESDMIAAVMLCVGIDLFL